MLLPTLGMPTAPAIPATPPRLPVARMQQLTTPHAMPRLPAVLGNATAAAPTQPTCDQPALPSDPPACDQPALPSNPTSALAIKPKRAPRQHLRRPKRGLAPTLCECGAEGRGVALDRRGPRMHLAGATWVQQQEDGTQEEHWGQAPSHDPDFQCPSIAASKAKRDATLEAKKQKTNGGQ